LRSVSAFESYRKIYRDVITPLRVAELLILRVDMPRSLHSCTAFIDATLHLLSDRNTKEIERQAGELHSQLRYGRIEQIMDNGLHEYLMHFLDRTSALSDEINDVFLVPSY
jgi:uncharacterized alpha-E superfamily protein